MRKKSFCRRPVLVHLLFLLLMLSLYMPGLRSEKLAPPFVMTVVCAAVEAAVIRCLRQPSRARAAGDIGAVLFLFLLVWQVYTSRLGLGHPILTPTPEAVFFVFWTQRRLMLQGIVSSLTLLLTGFGIALPLGTVLGLWAGWSPRLRSSLVPMARVLSPIPAIIYAPYLIALMPSFRSASAAVIVIGIFWPTFLQMVNRVLSLDSRIVDSALVLGLRRRELLFEVFLPWLLPGILSGLRTSLSSAFMLLTLAEMMGAHSGLGYFIRNFADYGNYTNVLAGILLVALVITLLNSALSVLERHLIRWR